MLIIRDSQLRVFEEAQRSALVDRLIEHTQTHLAARVADVDDARLRAMLDRVARDAARLGLTALRDVLLFTNLSVVYGEGFLGLREHAWMRDALADARVSSPSERLRLLYQEALRRSEGRAR